MSDDATYAPKYVQIVGTLRRRIADGTYPVGSKLPSESDLTREFGVSRPTVVRALNEMQLLGEIDREHGRGTYVKAAPGQAADNSRPGLAVLDRHETETALKVVQVGQQSAPWRVADRLGVAESARVHLRRYVSFQDSEVSELVSIWAPLDVARSAGLDQDGPLTVPLRRLLIAGTGERLVRVAEVLSARHPTKEEADLLKLSPTDPVLSVLASVLDSTGRTVLVVEIALPGTLHDLEDSYTL